MGKLITSGNMTMSSREIAELTGSTHDNVLKTVRGLREKGIVSGNETPYVHPQNGQTYHEFLLSYRDTMVVVSGYSVELRAKIIDRWQELEKAYGKKLRVGDEDWKRQRHIAASSYKVMSQLLQETRELEGKTSKPHHFMNEAKLINASITGEFKGIDRDSLSIQDLDLLGQIEIRNTILIARGFGYEERKKQLQAFTAAKLANSNQLALEVK